MGLNYFASSPVVVVPHPQSHYFQHHPHDDAIPLNSAMQDEPPARRFAPKLPTPPSLNYLAQSSNGVAGRKRSRDDSHDDHDHEAELEKSAGPVQLPKPKVEPVYGPGMTLIYPDEPELNISPDSQTGTWMEQKAEVQAASAAAAAVDRPRLPARKSSRRVSVDENLQSATCDGIDPIVLRLGIGWKRMSEAQAASTAGDETFIKKQYPYVQAPKILLRHEGLGIYVVRSDPIGGGGYSHQWWLFKEDLKTCRLLCNSDEEDVLRRLGNKKQDESGHWVPDILTDGQLIYAKDSAPPTMSTMQIIGVPATIGTIQQPFSTSAASSIDSMDIDS